MARPGTTSGAVEHRYRGKRRILVNRDHAELLRQEAIIRRDFGEEGLRRFWEEVNKRGEPEEGGGCDKCTELAEAEIELARVQMEAHNQHHE